MSKIAILALILCSISQVKGIQVKNKFLNNKNQNLVETFTSTPQWIGGYAYIAGDQVIRNGNIYSCKPWPYTGWCQQAAYDPSGMYGYLAWTFVSVASGDGGGSSTGGNSTGGSGGSSTISNSSNTSSSGNSANGGDGSQCPQYQIPSQCYVYKAKTNDAKKYVGYDWINTNAQLENKNGIVSGTSTKTSRLLKAARPLNCQIDVDLVNECNNPENVRRVMRVLGSKGWDYLFPLAKSVYTYKEFLKAIAIFPAICSEASADVLTTLTLDQVCKKELATMFAHMAQETGAHWAGFQGIQEEYRQALYYIEEMGCSGGAGGLACDYKEKTGWANQAYPVQSGAQYFGRGAHQLSWNYNYGLFSKVMYDDVLTLLKNPEKVANEGWLAISSALWFYVTPQSPKPSMHDLVTGFWVPNSVDISYKLTRDFGTTTNIINGAIECGKVTTQANNRATYYKGFMKYFGLEVASTENLTCANQNQFQSSGSAGSLQIYFDKDWSGGQKCKPVGYQTAYLLFIHYGYIDCVNNNF